MEQRWDRRNSSGPRGKAAAVQRPYKGKE